MNPPTQPFTRKLRSSHDVSIFFTPTATGSTVTYRRAHIFILSDLFLIAEWMDATDKAAKAIQVAKEQPERVGQGGPMPEMWLCYPPLAGRHLIFAEGEQSASGGDGLTVAGADPCRQRLERGDHAQGDVCDSRGVGAGARSNHEGPHGLH